MKTAEPATEFTLKIGEEERAELLRILEASLAETHMERRRTEAPRYHDEVVLQENRIRTLLEKVRRLGP